MSRSFTDVVSSYFKINPPNESELLDIKILLKDASPEQISEARNWAILFKINEMAILLLKKEIESAEFKFAQFSKPVTQIVGADATDIPEINTEMSVNEKRIEQLTELVDLYKNLIVFGDKDNSLKQKLGFFQYQLWLKTKLPQFLRDAAENCYRAKLVYAISLTSDQIDDAQSLTYHCSLFINSLNQISHDQNYVGLASILQRAIELKLNKPQTNILIGQLLVMLRKIIERNHFLPKNTLDLIANLLARKAESLGKTKLEKIISLHYFLEQFSESDDRFKKENQYVRSLKMELSSLLANDDEDDLKICSVLCARIGYEQTISRTYFFFKRSERYLFLLQAAMLGHQGAMLAISESLKNYGRWGRVKLWRLSAYSDERRVAAIHELEKIIAMKEKTLLKVFSIDSDDDASQIISESKKDVARYLRYLIQFDQVAIGINFMNDLANYIAAADHPQRKIRIQRDLAALIRIYPDEKWTRARVEKVFERLQNNLWKKKDIVQFRTAIAKLMEEQTSKGDSISSIQAKLTTEKVLPQHNHDSESKHEAIDLTNSHSSNATLSRYSGLAHVTLGLRGKLPPAKPEEMTTREARTFRQT